MKNKRPATVFEPPIAAALPAVKSTLAHPAPSLVGPITPDQYIAEMYAVGWECFAGCYVDRHGNEVHAGVSEHHGVDRVFTDEESVRRTRLLRAIGRSGPDFTTKSATGYKLGYRRMNPGTIRDQST